LAADCTHPSAGEHAERLRQLVGLGVVDQVTALDDGIGGERVDRRHRAAQHLRGKCLLGAERRGERRAEAIEERNPRRRLRVEHVRVGDVRQARELGTLRRTWREIGAIDERGTRTGR